MARGVLPAASVEWARAAGVVLAVLAVSQGPAPALPKAPDADEVMRRMDYLYRSKTSVARMDIAVTSPRTSRTMRIKAWTRGTTDALIVIEAPAREAGIATLRVGDNLWNYLPKVARTIRVPPSMMLGSWMGTDFTNDDLVKESSYRDDFVTTLAGRTKDGKGWLLVGTVKPGVVGRWQKLELEVDDELLPTVERSFDRKGRLARTMTFDEVKVLGGRRLPTHMALVPADTEGQKTEMRYLEVQFDAPLPEDTFSLSRLERGR